MAHSRCRELLAIWPSWLVLFKLSVFHFTTPILFLQVPFPLYSFPIIVKGQFRLLFWHFSHQRFFETLFFFLPTFLWFNSSNVFPSVIPSSHTKCYTTFTYFNSKLKKNKTWNFCRSLLCCLSFFRFNNVLQD